FIFVVLLRLQLCVALFFCFFFFFFQAEDGIRDFHVTGVQTCALPISLTLEVTRASRDVVLDGVSVREGDAIGLVDGTLATSARGYVDVLMELLADRAAEYEIATLFYAPDVGEEGAEAVVERIAAAHPDL